MSYKVEIQTFSCKPDAWTANAMRFATEKEAQAYALDLTARWTAVKEWRIAQDTWEVSHAWRGERIVCVPVRNAPKEKAPPAAAPMPGTRVYRPGQPFSEHAETPVEKLWPNPSQAELDARKRDAPK